MDHQSSESGSRNQDRGRGHKGVSTLEFLAETGHTESSVFPAIALTILIAVQKVPF